ncbi:MAG: hypothetical protein Q4A17_06555 [Thermoguttaceae bacterium]|nr:hypothetical protein [Thermoguttaceae bacterium]
MANSQFEQLPKPPTGEYVFTVKRAGIKNGAVWYVIGDDKYELFHYADLRKGALFTNAHCVLAGIIAETGSYCAAAENLIGRTVQARVVVQKDFTKIIDVRSIDE